MHTGVGVIGASGYSGMEVTRLLAAHPSVSLRFATSDRWGGETLGSRLPDLAGPLASMRYVSNAEGEARSADCEVVFLATPAETSLALAPKLLEKGLRVIDLSGAFRLRDVALYPAYYGFAHSRPALLADAVYGLPELNRGRIRSARLIANPGCYATAIALALAPLLRGQLLSEEAVIADAASGVTGAGRKATEDFSFAEIADDFRAYKTLKHQHTPEIRQTLALFEGRGERGHALRPLTFTPHLLPLRRGILATCYARLRPEVEGAQVQSALTAFAEGEPFIRVAGSADQVTVRGVVGTNDARLGAAVDARGPDAADPGRVVVTAALDNLLKGAAGQAVQNFNLMLELDERTGLDRLRPFSP